MDLDFVSRFNKTLKNRFDIDFKSLLCLNGKALVAGSLPLQVELDVEWEGSDMDVYTYASDVPFVVAAFILQGYTRVPSKDVVVGEYQNSGFLSRNHIKGFVSLTKNGSEVQIMSVRHDIGLKKVIERFDQSFCSISYDFNGVYPEFHGTTREEVQARSGTLRPEYVKMYYSCNSVLHNRIEKYTKRGMSLSIPNFIDFCKSERLRPYIRSTKKLAKYSDMTEYKRMLRRAFNHSGIEACGYDSEDKDDCERVIEISNPKVKSLYIKAINYLDSCKK